MRNRTIAQLAVTCLVVALVSMVPTAHSADEAGVVHFTAAGDFGSNNDTRAVLAGMKAEDPDVALAL